MCDLLPDWRSEVSRLRPFARVRLIIADLDGSLVRTSDDSVYKSLQELQRALLYSRHRVLFTVATGRAWHGARHLVDAIATPRGTPLIFYNGALIIENQTFAVIDRQQIIATEAARILQACLECGAPAMAYTFRDPISAGFQDSPVEKAIGVEVKEGYVEFNGIAVTKWAGTEEELRDCLAILIESGADSRGQAFTQALEQCDSVSITRSGTRFLEIRPHGANKGHALEVIADSLKIDVADVLALGDNDNDVEMLQAAGISVAVSGASKRALASSEFVCRHGPADGAVEILRLVKHAKRFYGRQLQTARR
jgi:Cof subfamily protein (haloacid dehalogenase superfamily)